MPARPPAPSRTSWFAPAAVLALAAVLVAVVVWLNWGPGAGNGAAAGSPVQVQGAEQPDLSGAETRVEGDPLAAGPVDAPVALVAFSDYQCQFCARWSQQTMPAMMEHVEAGDLRIEWRDVNVFGPASERAARASYAAAQQDAFGPYHDALFEGGETRSEGELSEQALIALASRLELDVEQFTQDLASSATAEAIAANQALGFSLGATSTPVFILGGQLIVGAQPTQVFEEAFQAALAAAQ